MASHEKCTEVQNRYCGHFQSQAGASEGQTPVGEVILPCPPERLDMVGMARAVEEHFVTLTESCTALTTQLDQARETPGQLGATRDQLVETIARQRTDWADAVQGMEAQRELVLQRGHEGGEEEVRQSSGGRYDDMARSRRQDRLPLSSSAESVAGAVLQQRKHRTEQPAPQRHAVEAPMEVLREQDRAAMEREWWEEVRRRRRAEQLAAVEAEECLTRHTLQKTIWLGLVCIDAKERGTRSGIRARAQFIESSHQASKRKKPNPAQHPRHAHRSPPKRSWLNQPPLPRPADPYSGNRAPPPSNMKLSSRVLAETTRVGSPLPQWPSGGPPLTVARLKQHTEATATAKEEQSSSGFPLAALFSDFFTPSVK